MKLQEAYSRILEFQESEKAILTESTQINKGANGTALERILGIKPGPNRLDFEDGELKTFTLRDNGAVKEDFRICSVWNKDEIKKKLNNVLVVGRNTVGQIIYCKIHRILEENPIFREYFDKEVDLIIERGPMNMSAKDTEIWIAKTQSKGGDAERKRSLYISAAAAYFLFYGEYPARARKAKKILVGSV